MSEQKPPEAPDLMEALLQSIRAARRERLAKEKARSGDE